MPNTSMHNNDRPATRSNGPATAWLVTAGVRGYAETATYAGTPVYPLFFTIVSSVQDGRGQGLEGLSR